MGFVYSVPEQPISQATEGFLRKLTYELTTDFKCSEKLGELVKRLATLSAEETSALEELVKIDYRMQNNVVIGEMTNYMTQTLYWSKKNVPEIEKILSSKEGTFKDRNKQIRMRFYQMANDFKKRYHKYSTEQYERLLSGKTVAGVDLPKDRTLKQLGMSKHFVEELAKFFKTNASSQLDVLKRIRKAARLTTTEVDAVIPTGMGTTVVSTTYKAMFPVLDILRLSYKSYKYIDYFLYYIYKEIC